MYVLAYVGIMANNMAIPAMGCLGYPCNGLPRHVPVMGCRFSLCTSNTSKSTTNTSTSSASASPSASLAKRGLQVIAVGKRAKMRDSLAKALVNAIPPFYK